MIGRRRPEPVRADPTIEAQRTRLRTRWPDLYAYVVAVETARAAEQLGDHARCTSDANACYRFASICNLDAARRAGTTIERLGTR